MPQPIVWQLQEPIWQFSKRLKGLEGLKRASGRFGPVKKRLGLPAHSLAAPRDSLAGSPKTIRQFRVSGKEHFGLPAHSLAAPRHSLAASPAFEGVEGFEGSGGFEARIRQFRVSRKERLGLPQPIVWQLQEPVWQFSKRLKGLKSLMV